MRALGLAQFASNRFTSLANTILPSILRTRVLSHHTSFFPNKMSRRRSSSIRSSDSTHFVIFIAFRVTCAETVKIFDAIEALIIRAAGRASSSSDTHTSKVHCYASGGVSNETSDAMRFRGYRAEPMSPLGSRKVQPTQSRAALLLDKNLQA
eukprot:IDg7049t1